MNKPLPQAPQQICILRLSALGDVCNLVPTVRAIARQWPTARITWIVGKAEYSLLSGLEGVELVVYDKSSGFNGMRKLWRELNSRKFDILLHMQQSIRASFLSLGISADVRLGYDKARAKDWQTLFTNARIAPHEHAHVLESFMDFAQAMGLDAHQELLRLDWGISVPDGAKQEAHDLLKGKKALVISPCANPRLRNFRNWSAEGYAAVIAYAWRKYGLTTFLTGGNSPVEKEMVQRIKSLCNDLGDARPVNILGQTTLKGLLAVIRQARAVIAPDSGPVHMANALGTPVIGLYATTNPDRAAPYLWRNYVVNRYPDAVRKYMNTTVDQVAWGTRVRHPEAMSLITPEDVCAQLDRLLSATEPDSDASPYHESKAGEYRED
ncbi:Lipopolysaccharide core heptosyltransferase RfaQ GT9 [Halomonadaceae bacterium LMG 33818]|uniref:glycosyltransferase family 9 protein n=1 Tax=Cernens ardua TaxID=3402176 RepID=UPI003EDBB28F